MGPVTGGRGVHDLAAVPLMRILGFVPSMLFTDAAGAFVLSSLGDAAGAPVLVAAPWAEPLDAVWRLAARSVLATGAPWCFSINGRRVRLLDVRRAVAGGFVEFDLESALDDDAAFAVLWGLLRRESLRSAAPRRARVDRLLATRRRGLPVASGRRARSDRRAAVRIRGRASARRWTRIRRSSMVSTSRR